MSEQTVTISAARLDALEFVLAAARPTVQHWQSLDPEFNAERWEIENDLRERRLTAAVSLADDIDRRETGGRQ